MMSESNRIAVDCVCGQRLTVNSGSSLIQCPICGQQLRINHPPQNRSRPSALEGSRKQPRLGTEPSPSQRLPTRLASNTPGRKKKPHRPKSRKKKNAFVWDFETIVLSSFLCIVLVVLALVSIFVGTPKAIQQFQLPNENELVEISGRPIDISRHRIITGRGTYTTLGFKVKDRGFSLPSYNWNDDVIQKIDDAVSNDTSVVLTVCADRNAYDHIPFWELKSENGIIVSKKSMTAKHQTERYGFVIAPFVFLAVILTGGMISLIHFLRRGRN